MGTIQKIAMLTMAGLLGTATAARADHFSIDFNVGPTPPPAQVWVQPVYQTRSERVWVEPVTQLQTQNVWHDPVTEDRVDQAWVPDRWEVRDVDTWDRHGHRIIVQQNVLVEPGHWQTTHTPVVTRAGYWGPEAVPVVVTPGYWQTADKTVCVEDGHWAPVAPCDPPVVVAPLYHDHYYGRYDYDHYDHWHGR